MFDNYLHREYVENYRDLYIRDHFWRPKYQCNETVIRKLLQEHYTWVDLCCGQGQYFKLAENSRNTKCIGVDASSEQIALAWETGIKGAEFIVADILDKNLPSMLGKADLITLMWGAYCYLSGPDEILMMLRNVSELLHPGGAFYIEIIEPATLSNFNSTEFAQRTGSCIKDISEGDNGSVHWVYEDSAGGSHQLYSPSLAWVVTSMARLGLTAQLITTVQTLHQVVGYSEK